MEQKKKLVKSLIAITLIVILAAGMLLIYLHFRQSGKQGAKTIVVSVVIPEKETKDFTIHTDAAYLRQALEEKKLVKGTESTYGLFITEVNGQTADDKKQEWWCVTKGGQTVNTGVDQTPISDGEHYEITLKTGY